MPIDYKKYPPNWSAVIRPFILKRANNKCENCGLENYAEGIRNNDNGLDNMEEYVEFCAMNHESEIFKRYGSNWNKHKWIRIILTIAHLDHDPENWGVKYERLKAFCQRCHIRYDAPEKAKRMREKKYGKPLFD